MSKKRCVLVKNPQSIPKLSDVLHLILKKTKTGSHCFPNNGYFSSTFAFKKSYTFGKRSFSLINDSLLNHRFDEAAKILWILCQDRTCFDLFLYKGIMVVLENLISNQDDETVKLFSRDIRKLRFINKLEIQLEYLIYALKNNDYDLEDSFKPKGTRKTSTKIIPYIEQLNSAYYALINYITWANISQEDESSKDGKDIAFNVIACFKKLVDNPGIWDIFILKLIEMLEHYEKYEEIEEVLKKYVERNPEHVNAYIYLCVHLHKHNADPNLFIHYSKFLFDMCPSDDRVLLLVQKWDELGKYLKKRLKILFLYLDYPVNGNKMLGWLLLSSHLAQAVSSKKSSTLKAVKKSWTLRCHSWNYMHFNSTSVLTENFELISCKVKVISVLDPNHEYVKNAQQRFQDTGKQHLVNKQVTSPNQDFNALYNLDDVTIREFL